MSRVGFSVRTAFLVCAVITFVRGEELQIKLPYATSSHHGGCVFPERVDLELVHQDQGKQQNIALKRNSVIPPGRVVYLMTSPEPGNLKEIRIDNSEHDGIQGYHNHEHGAAFIVRCSRGGIHKPYFLLEGSIFVADKKYRLSPSPTWHPDLDLPSSHMTAIYNMNEVSEFKVQDAVANILPKTADYTKNVSQRKLNSSRYKRQVPSQTTYNIDVLPVVDSTLYDRFYSQSAGNQTRAAQNIADYLGSLFTGVNMRMDTLSLEGRVLQIRMISPLLLKTPDLSPYYETQLDDKDGVRSINATSLLNLFKVWLVNRTSTLGTYDHAMFLTSLNVKGGEDSSIKFNITKGLAYVGAMCKTNGESSSVIEDKGAYQNEGVAAHELAHSFRSLHDGQNNTCLSSDQFIMADGTYAKTGTNNLNPWKFSPCSSGYILLFLKELEENETKLQQCLRDSIGSNTTEDRTISANEQCKLFYGNMSFVCRGVDIPSLENLCDEFYCRIPGTERCERMTAATGTCCGNQKKCMRGRCVSASLGQCPMDDVCPLGDQEGIILDNKTCTQLESQYCYSEDISLRCCDTCRKHFTGNQGCLYGDKQIGCRETNCGSYFIDGAFQNLSYAFICCSTCNNTCRDSYNLNYADSSYTCEEYILNQDNTYICYNQDIHKEMCCKSCEDARDATDPECPWGDRKNCSILLTRQIGYSCNSKELQDCCKTCSWLVKGVTTTTTTNVTTGSEKSSTLTTTKITAVSARQTTTCDPLKKVSCGACNIKFDCLLLCVLSCLLFFDKVWGVFRL